jgi:hypothetical protein
MKALFMQRLEDRGYPVSQLRKWFAAVDHACRVPLLHRTTAPKHKAGVGPVLVLPNGQFQMTARVAEVLNRVFAAHEHEADVASIFGGSDARLIVAYPQNRKVGNKLCQSLSPCPRMQHIYTTSLQNLKQH